MLRLASIEPNKTAVYYKQLLSGKICADAAPMLRSLPWSEHHEDDDVDRADCLDQGGANTFLEEGVQREVFARKPRTKGNQCLDDRGEVAG